MRGKRGCTLCMALARSRGAHHAWPLHAPSVFPYRIQLSIESNRGGLLAAISLAARPFFLLVFFVSGGAMGKVVSGAVVHFLFLFLSPQPCHRASFIGGHEVWGSRLVGGPILPFFSTANVLVPPRRANEPACRPAPCRPAPLSLASAPLVSRRVASRLSHPLARALAPGTERKEIKNASGATWATAFEDEDGHGRTNGWVAKLQNGGQIRVKEQKQHK